MRDKDLVRDAGLVEFDSGAGKLPVCLDEISGVRPQAGVVIGNHDVALTREAGQPFHLTPSR